MSADSWEGRFSWQGYALAGRPDFLNYLHAGDVTWEEVWRLCRDRPAPPDSTLRVMSLFHMFLSAAYDGAGCWLDPEGDVCRELQTWARFAVAMDGTLTETQVLNILAHLLERGLATRLYYAAAFATYVEAALDRAVQQWRHDPTHLRAAGSDETERAPSEARLLPAYAPDPARFAALQNDPEWEGCMNRLLDHHYYSWNRVYVATAPDEELTDLLQEVGGEG
jgi:hypothetical protein